MTIKEVIENYRRKGQESVSPTFRALIHQMIDTDAKTEFDNDSYADALYLTDVMFERSKTGVRILTGSNGGDFLEVLAGPFVTALERLQKVGGIVRIIILDSPVISPWLSDLTKRFTNLKVVLAKSTAPIKHFIVCDSRMARLEEIHAPLTPETPVESIKAKVFFNEPAKAEVYEKYFDSAWKVVAKE